MNEWQTCVKAPSSVMNGLFQAYSLNEGFTSTKREVGYVMKKKK
jgi:hypothetical protein